MIKEGSTKIVNFMTTVLVLGRGQNSYSEMHYFCKNIILYSRANNRQTKYIGILTKEGSTKNCKFHDPQGRDTCARAWPNKSYCENTLFL